MGNLAQEELREATKDEVGVLNPSMRREAMTGTSDLKDHQCANSMVAAQVELTHSGGSQANPRERDSTWYDDEKHRQVLGNIHMFYPNIRQGAGCIFSGLLYPFMRQDEEIMFGTSPRDLCMGLEALMTSRQISSSINERTGRKLPEVAYEPRPVHLRGDSFLVTS